MKKSTDRKGIVSLRAMAGIAAIVLLPVVLYAGAPAWWTSRHVTSGTASDYAGANQGQLKNMATAAFNELSANLPGGVGDMTAPSGTFPGGTGYQLTALINSWSTTTGGTQVEVTGSNTSDYAGVNIGQAKGVSRLFYKRLIEAGFASQYPWEGTGNPRNDYAGANIGQIKNLFSFDVTTDSGTDGVPDMWEMNWFGTIGVSGTSLAPGGSGLTILQCYEGGVNPLDYYGGVSPTLAIISGSGQTGASSAFLSDPLIVKVTGTSGAPMVNAPVTFDVTKEMGVLAPDISGTSATSSSLVVLTGTDGRAQVYFQQPFDASFTSTVTATAEASQANFSETTSADTGPPAAPSNVTAAVQDDGTVLVSWTDNSDNETGFTIQRSDNGGSTWTTSGTIAADTTNFLDTAAGVTPGITQYKPEATGSGTNTPAATSGTAIQPLPITNYALVNVSGTNAFMNVAGTNTLMDVINMALGDSNQVAYAYASGTYATPPNSESISFSGTNMISVNTWFSGTTSTGTVAGGYTLISNTTTFSGTTPTTSTITTSGTILVSGTPCVSGTICSDPLNTGTMSNIIADGTFDEFDGFRDESLMTGPNSYEFYLLGASLAYFPSDLRVMIYPANNLLLTPQGSAYGTVQENCYFAWDAGNPRDYNPTIVYNGFYWSPPPQTKKIDDFTGTSFTTSPDNLIVNNYDWPDFVIGEGEFNTALSSKLIYNKAGHTIIACSAKGYCGLGLFGTPDIESVSAGSPLYDGNDLFGASYVVSGTNVTIFYDPNAVNNGVISGTGSYSPTTTVQISGTTNRYSVTCTGTSFIPVTMNDNGCVMGTGSSGACFWNGAALASFGNNTEGVALNNQNMVIGYSTSGTAQTGMLWLTNSGTVSGSATMQSLVPAAYNSEVMNVIPYAISNADAGNRVSILCSGSVMETSGTNVLWRNKTLLFRVDATTPSGTSPSPLISIAKIPDDITFQTETHNTINSNGVIGGIGEILGTGSNATLERALLLFPEESIQIDSFIPQEWVNEPRFTPTAYIDNGNSRKTPLDDSFTTGTTIFTQNSPEFKVRQQLNLCTNSFVDPDNSLETASEQTTVGQTRRYKASVLVNGHIPAGAIPAQTGTAVPVLNTINITHPTQNVVVADIEMKISDPIVTGASHAPIHYKITLTIDRSDASDPTYIVTGTNSEFPAYEIYINGQRVYQFDPIPKGYGPWRLLFFDQFFYKINNLSQ